MEQPQLNPEAVLGEIRDLVLQNGQVPSKKNIKKLHPDVMRNALYYYPSWEHALEKAMELQ